MGTGRHAPAGGAGARESTRRRRRRRRRRTDGEGHAIGRQAGGRTEAQGRGGMRRPAKGPRGVGRPPHGKRKGGRAQGGCSRLHAAPCSMPVLVASPPRPLPPSPPRPHHPPSPGGKQPGRRPLPRPRWKHNVDGRGCAAVRAVCGGKGHCHRGGDGGQPLRCHRGHAHERDTRQTRWRQHRYRRRRRFRSAAPPPRTQGGYARWAPPH